MTDWILEYEEESDLACPACGHSPVRSRDCTELYCEDGWIDLGEEDWQDAGEYERCAECWGTGIVRWCPQCGADLQAPQWGRAMQKQYREIETRFIRDEVRR